MRIILGLSSEWKRRQSKGSYRNGERTKQITQRTATRHYPSLKVQTFGGFVGLPLSYLQHSSDAFDSVNDASGTKKCLPSSMKTGFCFIQTNSGDLRLWTARREEESHRKYRGDSSLKMAVKRNH